MLSISSDIEIQICAILQLKKSTKRLLGEKPSGSGEGREVLGIAYDVEAVNSIENTSAVKVEKVGDSTPVQDFEAMMSRRDSPEWVNKAIKNMKNKIFDLVEDSCEGDTYQKALECLVSLLKGCILEQVCLPLFALSLHTQNILGVEFGQLLVFLFYQKLIK